jgi:tetratricopeptide (TPR) repeat protein
MTAWLERRRDDLRDASASRPQDGQAALDLAIAEKLLGGVDPAFDGLARALAHLPPAARGERQRALFVLGLTWGDVGRPDEAVRCFEAVAALDPTSRLGGAARAYAASYREHHGLAASQGERES